MMITSLSDPRIERIAVSCISRRPVHPSSRTQRRISGWSRSYEGTSDAKVDKLVVRLWLFGLLPVGRYRADQFVPLRVGVLLQDG